MKLLAILLATSLLSVSSFGQSLSKQDVVDLKKAGLDKTVIIQQIQKDGISFEMNAATTIELKNLGFSDDVLSALLASKPSVTPGPAQPTHDDSIAALYKTGRFPELADRLRVSLKASPTEYKTEALLIMTLLKMKEKDAAQTEFQLLAAHDQDPTAAAIVKQVKALFDSLAKTEEAKGKLMEALKDYRAADAITIVDQLPASAVQKEILKISLDMYQGKFDQARDRFSKISFGSYAEKQRSTKILDQITKTETDYKRLNSRIEAYVHGPLAAVDCSFPLSNVARYGKQYEEVASMSAEEYVGLVSSLTQFAPLSNEVRNLSFHAELLTGNYGQLESLGDRILKDKESIQIPFFASGRFFRLVIDSQKKHIYTEADSHPFAMQFPNNDWSPLVPFDLAFDQIKGISQKARAACGGGCGLERKSYALMFEPNGVAPNYALMNFLICTAGEKAELSVTRNLGQYILHVIGGESGIVTKLADPSKVKGPSSGWLTGLLVVGATANNPSLRAAGIEALQADQAQQAANFQAQQAAWDSFTTRDTFNFVEADAFTGLEQLLGVLN